NTNADLHVAVSSLLGAHGGTAVLQPDGRTVRFTPTGNANDNNTPRGFGHTYKASDGTDDSASSATVTVHVAAVNDAPVAVDDSANTNEDPPVATLFPYTTLFRSNTNADLHVAVSSLLGAHGGTAVLQPDGRTVRFTPTGN